ncbi:MAG: GAF domain-containing protein [Candidatus Latescibacteria bacterium]|nr:GAF domain-containing protein [Candidatus Latescibacterota bacterium]
MNPHLSRATAYLDGLPPEADLHTPLADALATYIRTSDLTAAFVHLLPDILEITQSNFGFLAEVEYAGSTPYLHSHAVVDIYKANYSRRDIVTNLNFYNLDTLNGAIITSQKPVLSNDPATDPRAGGVPAGHMKIAAFLGLPFIIDDQLLGACALANRPGGYSENDIELCRPLCQVGGRLIAAQRG